MRFFIIIMAMAGMLVANDTDNRFQEILDSIRNSREDNTSNPMASNLKECQNEQDKIDGCIEKNRNFGGYTEQYYKNGKPNGAMKVYYDNGQLALEIPITNKEYHGAVKRYDKSGKLIYEANFRNDELITARCRNGKKISCVKIGADIMLTLINTSANVGGNICENIN